VPEVDALLDVAVTRLGGARRDGQHAMARAVTEAIEGSEHLVVQAGTGTGKSLGYLVPAVRHAVATDERVIVSTATLALQRQVITRDLPLVADAVADRLPRPATIALLKGWHNYLCVHKVAGGYPADEPTLFDLPGESAGAADHPAARAFSGKHSASIGHRCPRHSSAVTETWRHALSLTPGTKSSRSPVDVSSAHSRRRTTCSPSAAALVPPRAAGWSAAPADSPGRSKSVGSSAGYPPATLWTHR